MRFDGGEKIILDKKLKEARETLARCIGKKGIWASPYRYKDSCWTRDLAISVPALVRMGYGGAVRNHLEELCGHQRKDGKIPVLFLDNAPRWVLRKTKESIFRGRISFCLTRFFRGGIASISPWTTDSELMFVIGMCEYATTSGDYNFICDRAQNIKSAMQYIECNLICDGLMRGADWRDSRPDLEYKTLLSLNCFLYYAYILLGRTSDAMAVKDKINKHFWFPSGGYYRDYAETEDFDALGNALVIYYGIANDEEKERGALGRFYKDKSEYGYVVRGVTLPHLTKQEKEIMRFADTNGLVFPFITGFIARAAHKMQRESIAEQALEQLLSLRGMYEWYEPETGTPGGSPDQLWTAAAILDTMHELRYINFAPK